MRILLLILALIVGVMLAIEMWDLFRSWGARKWPSCNGKLTRWRSAVEPYSEGSQAARIDKLEYTYIVGATEYKGSRIGFGFPQVMDLLYIGRLLDRVFAKAPSVRVHYSRGLPSNSALVVGIQTFHLIKILGYGFLLFVLVVGIRIEA